MCVHVCVYVCVYVCMCMCAYGLRVYVYMCIRLYYLEGISKTTDDFILRRESFLFDFAEDTSRFGNTREQYPHLAKRSENKHRGVCVYA